ncbi:monocarboxylate transporter 12-like [Asterias rubens]|uniref:monocarboxylate transporter 12-like n=1 Tax=Asterias rubens TaxID=7604 RepID=UPI0014551BC0|nr:monocarboxylate transporter 12-like [Asterias rubens]
MSGDGNPRGSWFAVICLLVSGLMWTGILKGLGIMLPTFTEQFTTEKWLIGWLIVIVSGSVYLTGIFAAPFESIFGTRAVIVASGFMVGGSVIAASFATSVVQLTVILALGFGPGISFAIILSKSMIGRCFKTNYATANGIGQTGSPLGLILMAPLVQLLLDTYGWRGAMLLLGGISLHLVVCGALLRQPSTEKQNQESYQQVPSGEETKSTLRRDKESTSRIQLMKEVLMTIKRSFGISVCLQKPFWIPTVIATSNRLLHTLWSVYYVDHILNKGFSAEDAIVFCTAAGVAKLTAKLLTGPLVDRGVLKLRTLMAILLTLCSITLLTDPWMNSFWLAIVNVAIYDFTNGGVSSLVDVYTRELIGPELLTCAFSRMELVAGIVVSCSGFFPGLIYDQTGSYDLAFVMMGCVCLTALLVLVAESLLLKESM